MKLRKIFVTVICAMAALSFMFAAVAPNAFAKKGGTIETGGGHGKKLGHTNKK